MENFTTRKTGMEQEVRKALATQKRQMQIQVIREKHPVYDTFNFDVCSDQKITEMFRVLVETNG